MKRINKDNMFFDCEVSMCVGRCNKNEMIITVQCKHTYPHESHSSCFNNN
jgi:hypothetical protein